jgi:hypothetical protein
MIEEEIRAELLKEVEKDVGKILNSPVIASPHL